MRTKEQPFITELMYPPLVQIAVSPLRLRHRIMTQTGSYICEEEEEEDKQE